MPLSRNECWRRRSSITGCTSGSRRVRQVSHPCIERMKNALGASNVRIEPLMTQDVEQLAALAREIWFDHYVGLITTAQIEYMLEQRYNAAIMRAEMGRDDVWWDKLS